MKCNILITGGAGFIGSHLVKFFVNKYPTYKIFNVDKLTYSANLKNIQDLEKKNNYIFLKTDICDFESIKQIFLKNNINKVIHLAAESHVDRSINNPLSFAKTNVIGTLTLLQVAREAWKDNYSDKLFYHISTDEVYGSLNENGLFSETTKYNPRSPYAASKASSDHFVRAFSETYRMPTVISNCSNNYGPFQYPEKLIPLFINNILNNKPLTIYGNGQNVRDWIYVEDHVKAIDAIFHKSKLFETYNIGASNEWKNIDLVKLIIKITDSLLGREIGYSEKLITYVDDRKGHDFRYAINNSKLQTDLGWKPTHIFEQEIEKTILWYLNNRDWF